MQRNDTLPVVHASLLEQCLRPLLSHLTWKGTERSLVESMPHFRSLISIDDFCFVMKNLGYQSDQVSVNLDHLDLRLLPCLFVPDNGDAPQVIIEAMGERLSVFDSSTKQIKEITPKNIKGCLVVFKKEGEQAPLQDAAQWFKNAIAPRKRLLYFVGILSFLQAILMLASSVFVISVYDKVVATDSIQMLSTFSFGVIMALFMLAVLMLIRFRLLAYLGVYIQQNIGNAIFQQLLRLPPIYTESAPVGAQIARINDFNSVRDFFGSPLFGTLIEIPFLFIYLFAVWIIGGVLVFVPMIAMGVSLLVAIMMWRFTRVYIWKSSRIQVQQQNFLVESLWGMRSLQYAGLQDKWKSRFRDMNSESGLCGQRLQLMNTSNDAIFDFLMIGSGLATMIVGTFLVMDNQIQIGGLIGTMFIVWRLLSPVKTVSVMLPKLIQLKRSIRQINELMRVKPETTNVQLSQSVPDHLVGSIGFTQVTFRYPGADTPALSDLTFSVKPGEMLAVIGHSASGKSTLANLILAMYLPQVGRIYIDGRNIKQYDVHMLRTHIAYIAQKSELFYGTIAQNLRLSDPTATMAQLEEAAAMSNLLKDVKALPQGFDTRIRDYGDKQLGPSFCQKMNLARAYLRNANILVMDEPSTALDQESDDALLHFLQNVKGKKTVVMITHVREHVKLADTVMVLSDGRQVMMGAPAEILEKIPKGSI
ncbi:MAG TPA: peptidase domain-containing ABC transporter [Coxiellaceae bacterium]|nr:peptidase domain-containing ABC transporter [Coxiellaceae bacterium]